MYTKYEWIKTNLPLFVVVVVVVVVIVVVAAVVVAAAAVAGPVLIVTRVSFKRIFLTNKEALWVL